MSGGFNGLGFARPALDERKRAAMLALNAGSTAPQRVDPSMGAPDSLVGPPMTGQLPAGPQPAAPQQPAPQPTAAPPAMPVTSQTDATSPPPPAEPPPAHRGGIDWSDPGQVLRGIGHVLLSTAAGMEGHELPAMDLQKEQDERDKVEMAKTEFMFNATARAYEISRFAPPDKKRQLLDAFAAQVKRVMPDFDIIKTIELATESPEHFDETAPSMALLSEDGKRRVLSEVRRRGGRPEDIVDVLKDDKFMEQIYGAEDQQNAPRMAAKIQAIRDAMAKGGFPPDALAHMSVDDFMAQNDQLPEGVRLSPSELGTLKRQGGLQRALGIASGDRREPTFDDTTRGSQAPAPDQQPRAAAPTPTSSGPAGFPTTARPSAMTSPSPTSSPRGAGPSQPQPTAPTGGPKKRHAKGHQRTPSDDLADQVAGQMDQQQPTQLNTKRKPTMFEAPRHARGQTFEVPRDMTIPGIGPVKKGERVIYDPQTRKYRRPGGK